MGGVREIIRSLNAPSDPQGEIQTITAHQRGKNLVHQINCPLTREPNKNKKRTLMGVRYRNRLGWGRAGALLLVCHLPWVARSVSERPVVGTKKKECVIWGCS